MYTDSCFAGRLLSALQGTRWKAPSEPAEPSKVCYLPSIKNINGSSLRDETGDFGVAGKSETSRGTHYGLRADSTPNCGRGRGPGRGRRAPWVDVMGRRKARAAAPAPAPAPAAARPRRSNDSTTGETNSGGSSISKPAALTSEGTPRRFAQPHPPSLGGPGYFFPRLAAARFRRTRGPLRHERAPRLQQHQERPLLAGEGFLAGVRLLRHSGRPRVRHLPAVDGHRVPHPEDPLGRR